MTEEEPKYRAAHFDAIDAGAASALPKELVHLIASYVPPSLALRWTWLQSALAQLPTVTISPHDWPIGPTNYHLSYDARRRGACDSEPTATVDLHAVMTELRAHAAREVPPGDARNAAFVQRMGGRLAVAIGAPQYRAAMDDALAAVSTQLNGITRDWDIAFETERVFDDVVFRLFCPSIARTGTATDATASESTLSNFEAASGEPDVIYLRIKHV